MFKGAPESAGEPLKTSVERFQELGERADIAYAISVVAQWIAIRLIERHASRLHATTTLHTLVSGESTCGIANADEARGSDLRGMRSSILREDGGDFLTAAKGYFSNGPCDFVILSAKNPDQPDTLDALLLATDRVVQHDATSSLFGFHGGHTATLRCERTPIDYGRDLIGEQGQGHRILRECFDLERLLISAVLAGVLRRLLDCSIAHVVRQRLDVFQHVQEKIFRLHAAYENTNALLRMLCNTQCDAAAQVQARLSLLKLQTVDFTFEAATLCMESLGSQSLQSTHPAQRVLRDVAHLKFLGGTREVHKNFLVDQLCRLTRAREAA